MTEEAKSGLTPPAIPSGAKLSLVCNNFVLAERGVKRTGFEKFWFGTRKMISRLIVESIYLAGYLAVLIWSFLIEFMHPVFFVDGRWLIFFLFQMVITGVLLRKLLELHFSPFPTNVNVVEEGLSFAWNHKKTVETMILPWHTFSRISAYRLESVKSTDVARGYNIVFNIDARYFFFANTITFVAQMESLWHDGIPFSCNGLNVDFKTVAMEFPLDAFTLESDKQKLLSAVRSLAPQAVLDHNFMELFKAHKEPTFTQLWLDDMQSFRRQRTSELPPGADLENGRYIIENKLATGGQAKIYTAHDMHSNELVALKELVLPVSAGADVRGRAFSNVKNEAMLLAKLNHPGIVKILDNFVEDHRAYLVLEHIEGRTLRRTVQDDGALPWTEVVRLSLQICSFVGYLHAQSPPIVHRDLTPDNIMLTPASSARLLDFNVAQQLEANSTKTVVGKHNYMAPEQFKGRPCTQSDLYSLGCSLYYLLTGEDPLPLSCSSPAKRVDVPPELNIIVETLTKIDLSERYQSVDEVAADLRNLASARAA